MDIGTIETVIADQIADKRVDELKKIQKETCLLDAEFDSEWFDLELKFQVKYDKLFRKRSAIVNGQYDEDETSREGQSEPKGIQNFWLTVLKNVSAIRPMIKEHDEEILKYLIDIRANYKSPNHSFQLEFHFAPNEFFQNAVLTKTYLIKFEINGEYDGPEIFESIGCEIMWNADKNVTEMLILKHTRSPRMFKFDSFFNFFSLSKLQLDEIENDIELGFYLKERVIPRAVLYYTQDIEAEENCANAEIQNSDAKVQIS